MEGGEKGCMVLPGVTGVRNFIALSYCQFSATAAVGHKT